MLKAVADGPREGDGAEFDDPVAVEHPGVVRPVVRVVDEPVDIDEPDYLVAGRSSSFAKNTLATV